MNKPCHLTRRHFLRHSSLLLPFLVGGNTALLSPAQAYAQALPLQQLEPSQAKTLEILAEYLVPGARDAGIAHYLDQQLGLEPSQSLLMMRYLGLPVAPLTFYRELVSNALQLAQRPLGQLKESQGEQLLQRMASDDSPNWQGLPASLCHFILRADACDVVYGTEAGFELLGIPYRAHIQPTDKW